MQLKLFLLFRTTTLADEKNLNKPKQPQFRFSKYTWFNDRHDSSTVTVSMIPGASKDSNNHLPFWLVYFKTIACQRCVAKKDFAFMACQLNYVFFIPFQSIPSLLWLLLSSCNETGMLFCAGFCTLSQNAYSRPPLHWSVWTQTNTTKFPSNKKVPRPLSLCGEAFSCLSGYGVITWFGKQKNLTSDLSVHPGGLCVWVSKGENVLGKNSG